MPRAFLNGLLGWIATATLAIVAMVASLGVSAGHIWGRSAPDLALRFWLHGSGPMAQKAARSLVDPHASPALRRNADALARAALAYEPTSVVASRTRGLAASFGGRDRAARQWMTQAEALSRRDFPTQLWLIEDGVAHADVDHVLVHYDRALRTNRDAPMLLFPVLIAASVDPAVAGQLSRIIAPRPGWWGPFMNRMIGESSSMAALDLFARRLRLSPFDLQHPDFFSRTLQRMVDAGEFARADALYRTIVPGNAGPLRDGAFERDDGVLPFAWRLADESDLSGRIEPRPDGAAGRALVIDARGGRGGEVARLALAIAPGRYILRGQAGLTGSMEDSRPRLRLWCGSGLKAELAALVLPEASARPRAFATPVTVPAGCQGVWLGVEARSGFAAGAVSGDGLGTQDGENDPWIDNLSLTRADVS